MDNDALMALAAALALDAGVAILAIRQRGFDVVRKEDRIRLPEKAGRTSPAYCFESLDYPVSDRKLNGYYVEFGEEGEQSEPHEHPGAEIIYVLDGELVVNLDGEDFTLGQGDSMYFDCAHPHSYRRKGALLCAAIIVVTAESASA